MATPDHEFKRGYRRDTFIKLTLQLLPTLHTVTILERVSLDHSTHKIYSMALTATGAIPVPQRLTAEISNDTQQHTTVIKPTVPWQNDAIDQQWRARCEQSCSSRRVRKTMWVACYQQRVTIS